MIKGKQPEEIRKLFNIQNDFTPEEEAQIRRENVCACTYTRNGQRIAKFVIRGRAPYAVRCGACRALGVDRPRCAPRGPGTLAARVTWKYAPTACI